MRNPYRFMWELLGLAFSTTEWRMGASYSGKAAEYKGSGYAGSGRAAPRSMKMKYDVAHKRVGRLPRARAVMTTL